MNMIVRRIDGRLVAELPDELVERLGVDEGDEIKLVEADGAFSVLTDEKQKQRALVEASIEENHEVLRVLAK